MDDVTEALTASVAAACARYADPDANWNPRLWDALEEMGVTLLPVPEERGGAGGDLPAAVEALRVLGRHAAAVPVAETALLAGWLLAGCGADVPSGPLTAALADGPPDVLRRVPWAGHAAGLVILTPDEMLYAPRDAYDVEDGANLAGEPRDTVRLRDPGALRRHPAPAGAQEFRERGALARAALMAGAMERALELSVRYAREREQFGRPLAAFQAVQDHLAEMAGETLLATVAVQAAARRPAGLPVAAAKASAGAAAGTVARLAHQVHGALGCTDEHPLRHVTTRLWAWRDEFGGEAEWAESAADHALAAGGPGLWPLLTRDA
ncbi:acyl-CoA dehydrogenase [Spirillospora albida]|uniref:acyl-CoA dehydrogenase n=1 Tax=Spirillospora albida TaxID=58123 RepID=UPI0006916FF4|nr:acyl-CoA dehydrogenase [Spirillospora albida]